MGQALQLPDSYQIRYGNPKAKIVVMEYFSFGCESCIRLFKEDFEYFRRKYIDTGHVQWIFHPHPVDLITIQGMACLAKLEKKDIFLEAVFLEMNPKTNMLDLLEGAVLILGAPLPNLRCSKSLQATQAFKDAYIYLQTKQSFDGVPTIVINGKILEEFPDRQVVETHLKEALK